METQDEKEGFYDDSGLRVLERQGVDGGAMRGGGGSSKRKNGWDTKTLVGGDEGVDSRDDESLRGDDG